MATKTWTADETRDDYGFTEWGVTQAAPDRSHSAPDPLGQYDDVWQVTCKPGDMIGHVNDPGSPAYMSCEGSLTPDQTNASEGVEQWWALDVLCVDTRAVVDEEWKSISQWHGTWDGGGPGSTIQITPDKIVAAIYNGINPGVWITLVNNRKDGVRYEIVRHVIWSADKNKALEEWWCDGVKVFSEHVANLKTSTDKTYFKQGWYSNPLTAPIIMVYRGTRLRATFAEVISAFSKSKILAKWQALAGGTINPPVTPPVTPPVIPPVISRAIITGIKEGAILSGKIRIKVIPNPGEALAGVEFARDGLSPFAVVTEEPFEVELDTNLLTNGSHVIGIAIDGVWRNTQYNVIVNNVSIPPVDTSNPLTVAKAYVDKFRAKSPNIAGAFDELFKILK